MAGNVAVVCEFGDYVEVGFVGDDVVGVVGVDADCVGVGYFVFEVLVVEVLVDGFGEV